MAGDGRKARSASGRDGGKRRARRDAAEQDASVHVKDGAATEVEVRIQRDRLSRWAKWKRTMAGQCACSAAGLGGHFQKKSIALADACAPRLPHWDPAQRLSLPMRAAGRVLLCVRYSLGRDTALRRSIEYSQLQCSSLRLAIRPIGAPDSCWSSPRPRQAPWPPPSSQR